MRKYKYKHKKIIPKKTNGYYSDYSYIYRGREYVNDVEAYEHKQEAQTQNPQIHSIIAIFILSNSIKVSDRENNECLYYFFRFLFPMLLILSFSFA